MAVSLEPMVKVSDGCSKKSNLQYSPDCISIKGESGKYSTKGEAMSTKTVLALVALILTFVLSLATGNARAELKVGDEAPGFTLPSSQDRLVDYYKDYYGKHHLIITFFPAAFTPV